MSKVSNGPFGSFFDKELDESVFFATFATMGEKADRDSWKFFEFREDEEEDDDDDEEDDEDEDEEEEDDDEDSGGVVEMDLLLLWLLENEKLFDFST